MKSVIVSIIGGMVGQEKMLSFALMLVSRKHIGKGKMITSQHNINETYDDWVYRKRNVNSKAIIWSGVLSIFVGLIALGFRLSIISIPIFILGGILILIGLKLRK